MRVISWTVVFGAVSALVYTGLKPVLRNLDFPVLEATQVGGTIVAPRHEKEQIAHPLQGEGGSEAARGACEGKAEGRAEDTCTDRPR